MAEKIGFGVLEEEFNLQNVGEYDSPGKILKGLKKLTTEYNPEHQDFKGWDWIQETLGIGAGGNYIDQWEKTKEVLSDRYLKQGFAPDDSYRDAQDRFDRPPKMMEKEMEETKVKALLGMGPGPEAKYTGPFGKLGEYFSKNAAARDKLFNYMGSIGKEMVKPVQPGQEAASAFLPTVSRGITKGEEGYAAKKAAAAKTALDIATARQKISPMQYYSSKMQEARLMVPSSIEGGPDSAEGRRWIGKYLMSIGMPSQAVDLSATIDSLRMQLMQVGGDEAIKEKKALIDSLNRKIMDLVNQSIGGSSVTNIIPYSP